MGYNYKYNAQYEFSFYIVYLHLKLRNILV